ncbi:PefC/AfrB family outer membrane usher protein [Salmonella enterica subsp. diarizonae]|nr:outer membrane usher protein PefC [Salmonella enterica subsp. diarizonae]EDV3465791.1 PefC/AfrB family outer membrane usher protein [Salmonella enterica subsp. diarizonae]
MNRKTHQLLKVSLLCLLSNNSSASEEELNMQFIKHIFGLQRQGVEVFFNGSTVLPGNYILDVRLNNEFIGRADLDVSQDDNDAFCLKDEWLSELGVVINKDFYKDHYNIKRACYEIGKEKNSIASFDNGSQVFSLYMPQAAYTKKKNTEHEWSYGDPGFNITYDTYLSKNDEDLTIYGNLEGNVNLDKWVLYGRGYKYEHEQFITDDITLSRAIKSLEGDLIIGNTYTSSSLMDSFSFYGVQLRSNNTMTPERRSNYSPIISGIAKGNARVTIKQNGVVLLSQMVPPGPFNINNVRGIRSGELVMTVTEEDGSEQQTRIPVTVIAKLLSAGHYNYDFAIGNKEATWESDNIFAYGSVDYGLNLMTLNASLLFEQHYSNAGIGAVGSLSSLGAISVSGNVSRAKSLTETEQGYSASVNYSKNVGVNGNLQIIGYKFSSEGYSQYASFDYRAPRKDKKQKERYEVTLTQQFPEYNGFLSISGWKNIYWKGSSATGTNASYTKNFGQVNLSVNGSYSREDGMKPDYMLGLNVNIPFRHNDRQFYSNSGVTYNRNSGIGFNSGFSENVTTNFNYNVNTTASKDNEGISLGTNYTSSMFRTSASVSKNRNNTNVSAQIGGAIIGVKDGGVMLTSMSNSSVAVVQMEGLSGYEFTNGVESDWRGRIVYPLTTYMDNNIQISTDKLPSNIELTESIESIIPTNRAIKLHKVKYKNISRYVLKVYDKNGFVIPMGTVVKNSNGEVISFVNNNGISLLNIDKNDEKVFFGSCAISTSKLKDNVPKIQEVNCE